MHVPDCVPLLFFLWTNCVSSNSVVLIVWGTPVSREHTPMWQSFVCMPDANKSWHSFRTRGKDSLVLRVQKEQQLQRGCRWREGQDATAAAAKQCALLSGGWTF